MFKIKGYDESIHTSLTSYLDEGDAGYVILQFDNGDFGIHIQSDLSHYEILVREKASGRMYTLDATLFKEFDYGKICYEDEYGFHIKTIYETNKEIDILDFFTDNRGEILMLTFAEVKYEYKNFVTSLADIKKALGLSEDVNLIIE